MGNLSLTSFAVALLALAACSGKQPARPTTPGSGGTNTGETGGTGTARRPITAGAICDRIFELKAGRCDLLSGYGLSREECEADYVRSLEERGDEARIATGNAGRCLLDNQRCEAVTACFENMTSSASEGEPAFRACSQRDVYAPVGLSRADWERRKGAGVRKFSQAASTKEAPVAVCGIPSEMTWLLDATCDDGSNPFESYDHAHAARVGNVGPGGACGSIVDLYEVPCPEGTYPIYLDAYVCPVPEGQPVP